MTHFPRNTVCMVILTWLTLLTGGCATVQQETRLPMDLPKTWSADTDIRELPITAGLLDIIHDENLTRLVREAQANNPDLRATALRLQAAGHLLGVTRSRQLPSVKAGCSKGRSNETLDPDTGAAKTADTHELSLGLSWEVDIWGRLADEHAAATRDVAARTHDYRYARDALATRVIQAWIDQVAARRSVGIEQRRVQVLQRIEATLVERYRNGLGSLDELSTAKSRTQIAVADLSGYTDTVDRASRKLEILLGRYPKGDLRLPAHLPEIDAPPVRVPAQVLLNRPDVQSSLARVTSARHTAGAAEKAMLPGLDVTGRVFRENASLSDISGATTYWNLLGSLFQPLFEGGRLRAESRARRAEADAALIDLHAIILRALKEVEDALGQERLLMSQTGSLGSAVGESEKSSRYYEERYRQGLDTIQTLLIAKEQEMAVKIRLNEVMAARLMNRIDLALALGMGVTDTPAPSPGVKYK